MLGFAMVLAAGGDLRILCKITKRSLRLCAPDDEVWGHFMDLTHRTFYNTKCSGGCLQGRRVHTRPLVVQPATTTTGRSFSDSSNFALAGIFTTQIARKPLALRIFERANSSKQELSLRCFL